jgi:hypothetical protein
MTTYAVVVYENGNGTTVMETESLAKARQETLRRMRQEGQMVFVLTKKEDD